MAKQFSAIEIDDAKIAQLTADTTSAPTYATAIDIPYIQDFTPDPQFKTAELEGDAEVVDIFSKCTKINFSFSFNSMPLDAIAVFEGSTLTASGTTPNQIQTLTQLSTDRANFFKLSGRWLNVKGIDNVAGAGLQVILYKCKATSLSYTLNGNFASGKVSGTAIRANSNSKIRDIVGQETQAVLS